MRLGYNEATRGGSMAKKTDAKTPTQKPTADEGKLKALGLAMDQITKSAKDRKSVV